MIEKTMLGTQIEFALWQRSGGFNSNRPLIGWEGMSEAARGFFTTIALWESHIAEQALWNPQFAPHYQW